MRKKSHILLARYLADQMQTTASLQSHRKAFCLGSILPDIKPSFITRRHEFYGTFEDVKNRMKELTDIRPDESNQRVYWRRFGEEVSSPGTVCEEDVCDRERRAGTDCPETGRNK